MPGANLIIPFALVCAFCIVHKVFQLKQHKRRQKENAVVSNDKADNNLQIDLQEEAFGKISAEIHDNISLTLSLSKLQLSDLDYTNQPELRDKISRSVMLLKKAIADLNTLSKSMSSDAVEKFGLIRAIEELVGDVANTRLLDVHLSVKGITRDLPPGDDIIVFRIIQESLNNVIRHAAASAVEVSLEFDAEFLALRIHDNGTGFDINNPSHGSGIGNMKKRAEILKATLIIESKNPSGTTIKLLVPLNPNPLITCIQTPLLLK